MAELRSHLVPDLRGDTRGVERVRLKDGTCAVIRPLLSEDRDLLRDEFEHLTAETRYHRFLTVVLHLTPGMLHHLVDDVDGVDHVAFLLSVVHEEGAARPVGVARVIRYPENPSAADVAVTVMDEWQGRGVAAELLKVLRSHLPEGVVRIETEVAADNPASLALLRHLGHPDVTATTDSRLHVVVQLDDAESCAGTANPGSIEST